MTKDAENIGRLQMMEHNLQALEQQRQQVQSHIFEIENALGALQDAKTAFRIVGGIMVNADPATLKNDLEQKKEVLDVRIASLEKQEQKLRDNAKSLQNEVMEGAKK